MTEEHLLELIESCIVRYGSAKNTAQRFNISPQYLCDIRKGKRAPGDTVLKHLGLKKVTSYERA
jgi:hypothetical protein